MNQAQANQLIQDLYQAVDKKNVHFLEEKLSGDVNFRIGNNPSMKGLEDVLQVNADFFASIDSMQHTINRVVVQENQIACDGKVDYVRLDGSECSAVFSTFLTMQSGKISDYCVYADLSGL